MKHLTAQLRVVSLLSFVLLALAGAFGQITPSGDAYTNTVDPTTNYGAKILLDVDAATQTTYIQFNLASIPATYTSADVTKATLKLYVNTVLTAGSFNVDYVNGTWAESTITSSLAPALGTTIAASVPITTADKNQFVLIDVTAAVQAWLSGTANDGIALVANGTFNATFDSKESTSTSHAPELDIVFAGTLSGVTTASGSGLTGGGTSGTLNLGLLTSCASGQVLEWNGTAWACATAAGTGTVTSVASGTGLTGGPIVGSGTLSINPAIVPLLASANTFTANQTVTGTLAATSGSGNGVAGATNSATAFGVFGSNAATTGTAPGVYGTTASSAGFGVEGAVSSPTGYGVYGLNYITTGTTAGVYGTTASPSGYGVEGVNAAPTGKAPGVYGTTMSTFGYGVEGQSPFVGVYGQTAAPSNEGKTGLSSASAGVWGDAGGATEFEEAVLGTADDSAAGFFLNNSGNSTLVVRNDTATFGAEVFLAAMPNLMGEFAIIGDPGCGEGSGNWALQLGQGGMSGCTNYTLVGNGGGSTYLNANTVNTKSPSALHLRVNNTDVLLASSGGVSITGTLSATGTKNFRIDHPLDPANKYLLHAAIESSEVLNLYTGNAILDASGEAVVQLPDWFEVLNKDFRYQLTNIGGFAPVYIAEEVSGGHFKIAGGKPGAKVSWQITGVRNDVWEKAYPMVVEEDKGTDRGHYLTPELYGQPATARIGYEALPPGSEQVVRHRPSLSRRGNASPMAGRAPLSLPAPPTPTMQKPVLPRPIQPQPMPKVAPLSHLAALTGKPEVNQK